MPISSTPANNKNITFIITTKFQIRNHVNHTLNFFFADTSVYLVVFRIMTYCTDFIFLQSANPVLKTSHSRKSPFPRQCFSITFISFKVPHFLQSEV